MKTLYYLFMSINISATLGDGFNSNSFDLNNTQTSDQSNAVPYIIGGQEAKAFHYPYMVYITDKKQRCGGSIIGRNMAITAAHCIGSQNPSDYSVIGHRHDLRAHPRAEHAIKFPVKKILIHPNYNPEQFETDIALLFLDNDNPNAIPGANMDNMLQLDTNEPRYGTITKLVGWGVTREGKGSPVLREVDLKVVSGEYCNKSFQFFNPDQMICVGPLIQGESGCRGDSGGPLVAGNILIGLVSYGTPNCDYPFSVYTKVTKYVDWINQFRLNDSEKSF